jgi:hypothetical protein
VSTGLSADDLKALELFESGMKSYEIQDYKAAALFFELAIEQKTYDGQIKVQIAKPKYSWIDTPRGPKRQLVNDGTGYKGYFANDYLNRTQAAIAKKNQTR